jgi:hypothetical protein
MADNASGCLGALITLTFIGSTIFGGGILLRIGSLNLGLGHPVDKFQIIAEYLDGLESKAKVADESVQKFHKQLNQGKCQEIYEQATVEFKQITSQSEVEKLCAAVNSQIGLMTSTKRTEWWGRPGDQGGHYLFVRYNTEFSRTPAYELFTWLVKDGKSSLGSYEIFLKQTSPKPTPSLSTPTPPTKNPFLNSDPQQIWTKP